MFWHLLVLPWVTVGAAYSSTTFQSCLWSLQEEVSVLILKSQRCMAGLYSHVGLFSFFCFPDHILCSSHARHPGCLWSTIVPSLSVHQWGSCRCGVGGVRPAAVSKITSKWCLNHLLQHAMTAICPGTHTQTLAASILELKIRLECDRI